MAFEVFDDVAFYWFLMSTMVAIVVPMTYSFMGIFKWRPPENWRSVGAAIRFFVNRPRHPENSLVLLLVLTGE